MSNQINAIKPKTIEENGRDKKMAEIKKAQQMSFKLLMTQLKYQDVDSPVDMNQLTQNLFQMNQLDTLKSIDYKLDNISTGFNKSGSLSTASNIIGKFAVTKGDSIAVDSQNSEIPISYIIDSNGQNINATMQVLDANGKLVHEVQIDNIKGNAMQNFALKVKDQNGQLIIPEGVYTIQFLATNQDNQFISTELFTTNKIQQVMMNGKIMMSNGQKITDDEILAIQESPLAAELDLYNPYEKSKLTQSVAELMKLRNQGVKV